MSKFLHIMTTATARKAKIRSFYTARACLECKTNEKYMISFGVSTDCYCVECYPNCMDVLSRSAIFVDEKKKNTIKKKAKKDNWSIPEVYGGYNTCK